MNWQLKVVSQLLGVSGGLRPAVVQRPNDAPYFLLDRILKRNRHCFLPWLCLQTTSPPTDRVRLQTPPCRDASRFSGSPTCPSPSVRLRENLARGLPPRSLRARAGTHGWVQPHCGAQRSNLGCNPFLARTLVLQEPTCKSVSLFNAFAFGFPSLQFTSYQFLVLLAYVT